MDNLKQRNEKLMEINKKLSDENLELRSESTKLKPKSSTTNNNKGNTNLTPKTPKKYGPPPVPTHTRPKTRGTTKLTTIKSTLKTKPTSSPPKLTATILPPKVYTLKEREIILTCKNESGDKPNDEERLRQEMGIRNAINNSFKKTNAPVSLQIVSVKMTTKGNFACLTDENHQAADALLYKEPFLNAVKEFNRIPQQVRKNRPWKKMVIHGIPTYYFPDHDMGMKALQQEIESMNKIRLTSTPRYLTSRQQREGKHRSSVVICFEGEPEEVAKVTQGLWVTNTQHQAVEYRERRPTEQCSHCLKYGHGAPVCRSEPACRFCTGRHHSSQHKCTICPNMGRRCQHMYKLECVNCGENHVATHPTCRKKMTAKKPAEAGESAPNTTTTPQDE